MQSEFKTDRFELLDDYSRNLHFLTNDLCGDDLYGGVHLDFLKH